MEFEGDDLAATTDLKHCCHMANPTDHLRPFRTHPKITRKN